MSLKEDRTTMGDTIWMEEGERELAQERILEREKKIDEVIQEIRKKRLYENHQPLNFN